MKTITDENVMKDIRAAVSDILARHSLPTQNLHIHVSVDSPLPRYEDSVEYLLKLLVHLEPVKHNRAWRLIDNNQLTPSRLSQMNLVEVERIQGMGFKTLIQLSSVLEQAGIDCPWIRQFHGSRRYRHWTRFSRK